jgi:SNF2 family DNA or RNA helicase
MTEENFAKFSEEIIINESFIEEESLSLENINELKFESEDLLKLKLEANEISKESEISELISYHSIKKNLSYEFSHQYDGAIKILRDFNGNALLADEVGLGKTITTGMVLKECIHRGFVKKALILTPPSLVDQWLQELKEKFDLNFKIIEDENNWLLDNFLIASIDKVKIFNSTKNEFRHKNAHLIPWDLIVVDEAHKLKDKDTMRWKFVDRLQKKRFLILSATPFQNDLLELYNLLHLLKRGHLGTMNEFKKQFLNKGNKRIPINPRELKRKLDEVMIRRRRDQTTVEYKQRIPKILAVELSKEELEVYNSICDMLKTKYFSCSGNQINGKLVIFSILPKITSSSRSAIESLEKIVTDQKYHADTRELAFSILESCKTIKKDSKIEKLIEIIEDLLSKNKNQKILIYTRHPTTLKYIVEKLSVYNLNIIEFTGGLTREEKTERINRFKTNANILISTDTGAEGLNFQFCNILINYDLPWNPMSVEQRIGRLDRIGQKNDVLIYSLATKNTMEEHVVDLIINKMCCIGLVIGELPIILFNLGLDDETNGINKIEEMLMNKFLDSKNNLQLFSKGVEEIAKIIKKGIESYNDTKKLNKEVLDSFNKY